MCQTVNKCEAKCERYSVQKPPVATNLQGLQ
jgi:hypothetical protein